MLLRPIDPRARQAIIDFNELTPLDQQSIITQEGDHTRDIYIVDYIPFDQETKNMISVDVMRRLGGAEQINDVAVGTVTLIQVDKVLIDGKTETITGNNCDQLVVVTKYLYRGIVHGDPRIDKSVLMDMELSLRHAATTGYMEWDFSQEGSLDPYINTSTTLFEVEQGSPSIHFLDALKESVRLPIGDPRTFNIIPFEEEIDQLGHYRPQQGYVEYCQFDSLMVITGKEILHGANIHVSKDIGEGKVNYSFSLESDSDSTNSLIATTKMEYDMYISNIPTLLSTTFLTSFLSNITFKWDAKTKTMDIDTVEPTFGKSFNKSKMRLDFNNVIQSIILTCENINATYPMSDIYVSWSEYGVIVRMIDKSNNYKLTRRYTQLEIYEMLLMSDEVNDYESYLQ